MDQMAKSLFWRAVAVVACIGLLMIGYGLVRPDDGINLIGSAKASYVAVGPKGASVEFGIVTAEPDGKTIYEWTAKYVTMRQATGSCVRIPYSGLD
jgi:hypothetical protein